MRTPCLLTLLAIAIAAQYARGHPTAVSPTQREGPLASIPTPQRPSHSPQAPPSFPVAKEEEAAAQQSVEAIQQTHSDEPDASYDEEQPPVFVPTHEWQAIKRGQAIPPGLHVSLDLSTGERKAKLLDEDEQHTVDTPAPPPVPARALVAPALASFLSRLAITARDHVTHVLAPLFQQTHAATASNLAELVQAFVDGDCGEVERRLHDLAEFADDTDQAACFASANGFNLLYPMLNDMESACGHDEAVRSAVWRVLGTAAQKSSNAQSRLLDDGLLSLVVTSLNAPHTSERELARIVHASAAVLHNHPRAQYTFSALGGWSRLGVLFTQRANAHGAGLGKVQTAVMRELSALVFDMGKQRSGLALAGLLEAEPAALCASLVNLVCDTSTTRDVFVQSASSLSTALDACSNEGHLLHRARACLESQAAENEPADAQAIVQRLLQALPGNAAA